MSDFLDLEGKNFLVTGFANRKSIAWHVGNTLLKQGANVVFSVRSPKRQEELSKLLPTAKIIICDFEKENDLKTLNSNTSSLIRGSLDGILHSIR